MKASVLLRSLATLLVSLSCATAHAQRLDAVQNSALSGAGFGTSAQQQRVTVSQPNGKPWVITEDMRVKVLGGHVRFERWWTGIAWVFAPAWTNLQFDAAAAGGLQSVGGGGGGGGVAAIGNQPTEFFGGTGQLGGAGAYITNASATGGVVNKITRNLAEFYSDANGSTYTAFTAPRYTIRPYGPNGASITGPISVSQELIVVGPGQFRLGDARWSAPNLTTWRWEDRAGDWVEYNANGRIVRYGDRNNVTVNFRYVNDVLTAVLDHFGNEVLRFTYVAGRLTEVQDVSRTGETLPTRSVKYEYDARGSINKVIDVMGNPMTYGYAADGKLTSVTDQENRTKRFEYGASNRVSKFIDADGSVTDYRYDYNRLTKQFYIRMDLPLTDAGRQIIEHWIDAEGRVVRQDAAGVTVMESTFGPRTTRMTDANGNVTIQNINEFDLISSIQFADGSTYSITYDSRFLNVLQERDENGVVKRYEYDSIGNLRRRIDAEGTPDERVTFFEPNSFGYSTSVRRAAKTLINGVQAPEVTVGFGYDDFGNVTSSTDGEGKLWRYEVNRLGDDTATIDPRGRRWTYGYDARGLLTSEADPIPNMTRYQYDKVGNLSRITDGRDKDVALTYDSRNRQTELRQATGGTWSQSYDARSRLVNQTDSDGRRMRVDYDVRGRPVRSTDGKGQVVSYDYADPVLRQDKGFGRPGTVTYPTFKREYRYNERHRVTLETDIVSAEGRVNGYTYDRVGRAKTLSDPNGKTWQMEYDALGRIKSSSDPLGNANQLIFDNRGNVVEFRDPKGNSTAFQYDRRNLLTQETDALGKVTRYRYDDNGWLEEMTLANGKRIVFDYDVAGRLRTRSAYDASAQLEQTVTFGYDAANNLTSWTEGTYNATLVYDDDDRLTQETVNYGAFSLSHQYTYYSNNLVRTFTGPDGVTVTYGYDAAGQLQSVELPGEGSINVQDWDWQQPKQILYPGGTQQLRSHSGYQELTGLTVRGPTQQTVFELANKYGKLMDVSERTVDGTTALYGYDDAVRLTSAVKGGTTQTFVLDPASNRTQGGSWIYDRANQLTSRGTISYTYDDAGNLARKVDSSVAEPARTTNYSYDAFNRLFEVRDGANALIARFAYDPFDRRLRKETTAGSTFYLQGEQGVLAEANSSGAISVGYGWHPEHPYGTAPLYAKSASGYVYFHNDHLGTPWRATDRNGAVVWRADYDAFGRATIGTGTTFTNNLRFPGQYEDAETGLHYNDRRYYDPATGRYLTRDPIGLAGGANQYLYAIGNPVVMADPTGECPPCAAALLRVGLTWAYRQFMTCFLPCAALNGITEAALNCGNVDLPELMLECGAGCLLSLLPFKLDPCGKLPGWLGGVFGAGFGAAATAFDTLNSFPGDTLVHVKPADHRPGEARTALKPINELRPGDEVLAWSEWKPASGQLSFEKITDTISSEREQTLVRITLDTGETITATAGHPLNTNKGWRDAVLLKRGEQLLFKGSSDDAPLRVATIADTSQESVRVVVYNLQVANAHTFFVGEDGFVAHNGVIYRVPGCRTPSKKKYIGRTKHSDPKKRGNRDGRDRQPEDVIDTYPDGETQIGRQKEQDAIDREGGVPNLDNRRNEIRKKKRR